MGDVFPAILTERGVSISVGVFVPGAQTGFLPTINFLIDTGASITNINEIEAEKFGIDSDSLRRSSKPVMTCGGTAQAFVIDRPVILLPNKAGAPKEFPDLPVIHLLKRPIKKSRKGEKEIEIQIPNLLGRDFFIAHRLRLVVDYRTNTAFIED